MQNKRTTKTQLNLRNTTVTCGTQHNMPWRLSQVFLGKQSMERLLVIDLAPGLFFSFHSVRWVEQEAKHSETQTDSTRSMVALYLAATSRPCSPALIVRRVRNISERRMAARKLGFATRH